ncbi:1-(5-phosphoribosyl)-5-[(5-phosphoribosylamino)methylideneamino]imidazole-4-carboxamide isomerase [Robiginitalea sp. IMCC44478]|uniref:1-(5-phosphoribosyl)-5-[(5- phosphoribosylamino)methylideneamino]imidazole-4- carboxamide isomerase n=1 Tax=Robiginitalea sp. IMCC44478 TaxID=3459122 RepID=UPI004040F746
MRLIPAIDIIGGKCVRLTRGDYATEKVYNEDPLEVARHFEGSGIEYLHLVDLDGARSNHIVNYKVLEAICSGTSLKVDFGGGLKSDEDLRIAFECGARQVTGGSIAVKEPETFLSWLQNYGAGKIILGADVKNGSIAVSGWQEGSSSSLIPFVQKFQKAGIQYVICTDVSKDGMLQGPATELYRELLEATSGSTAPGASGKGIKLIASGGVSTIEDLTALKETGCEGAIIGKALYEGKISLKQLQNFISEN